MSTPIGATRDEWSHFAFVLGLSEDLLPVVSDQSVPISERSKMRGLGKTPSIINREGRAAGISEWTSKRTTAQEIRRWSSEPRYGICIQTRTVRAIDVDVEDPSEAEYIFEAIEAMGVSLPCRRRPNSAKFLLPFSMPGDYPKRVIRTSHGVIEFLASGQQFIASGTHSSGVRYEWEGGLPDEIPVLSPAQFEHVWASLAVRFGTEEEESRVSVNRKLNLSEALSNDPVAQHLLSADWVLSDEPDGRLHIRCPFEDEHTTEGAESATTYFPANTNGFAQGHFRCLHAHCQHRTDYEFQVGVGYETIQFEDITHEPDYISETPVQAVSPERFLPVQAAEFAVSDPPSWLIKGVIPDATLGVIFGDSGSGKSFAALDLGMALARGVPWRGHPTVLRKVAYIAAEGAGGFKKRLSAFAQHHGIDLADVPFYVIAAAPNMLDKRDPSDLAAALVGHDFGIIIVDTWAQVTAGGNENSSEDMGRALKNCLMLHNKTGAMVLLIHHSGKNSLNGARGWSGLRAAADVEMEVVRVDDDRVLSVTKQKDGEEGQDFGFRLRVVPIGVDEDGDEITSCVVDAADVKVQQQRQVLKLGHNERVVLLTVRDNVGLDGMPPDVNSVLTEAAEQLPYDPASGRDRRREVVRRALEKLLDKGLVVLEDGRVAPVAGRDSEDNQEDTTGS